MKPLVLVTYATRAGSTVDIAVAIGKTLKERGYAAEVKPIKEALTMEGYQAVIIGSPIRSGVWLPEAVEFIQAHQARLNDIPTVLFTVHMLNTGDDEVSRQAREAYTAPVRAILTPKEEVFFKGKLNPAHLPFLDRLITSLFQDLTPIPTGDYRDWNKIYGWAQNVFG